MTRSFALMMINESMVAMQLRDRMITSGEYDDLFNVDYDNLPELIEHDINADKRMILCGYMLQWVIIALRNGFKVEGLAKWEIARKVEEVHLYALKEALSYYEQKEKTYDRHTIMIMKYWYFADLWKELNFIATSDVDYHNEPWEKEGGFNASLLSEIVQKSMNETMKNLFEDFERIPTGPSPKEQVIEKLKAYEIQEGLQLIKPSTENGLYLLGADATPVNFANALNNPQWASYLCGFRFLCTRDGRIYGPGDHERLKRNAAQREMKK